MPEIQILKKIFKAFFKDIKTEDKNKICFQYGLLPRYVVILIVPYLKRSNPINKYIGMILHTLKKDS